MRRPDDFVARYGGEEFAVVLPNTDLFGANHVGEKVRAAIASLELPHKKHPLGYVTVSIGVAVMLPEAGLSAASLIGLADTALYVAKTAGGTAFAPSATLCRRQGKLRRTFVRSTMDRSWSAARSNRNVLF